MKPKSLLVMLALVLGLGAFIWFFEKDVPSTEERQVLSKKVLGVLKTDDVTSVTVLREGKTVRFERDGIESRSSASGMAGSRSPSGMQSQPATGVAPPPAAERPWRMVQPLQARADKFAVDRLLDSLANLTKESSLDAGDRKELGFDAPRAKVTLTAHGKDTVLEIGAAIPASSNMAVAVDGGAPSAAPSYVFTDLSKEPGEWRSKDLFPALRDSIERIVLTPDMAAGGPPITLVKKGDEFRLESPVADRADRDAVNALLGDLTALQAAKFADAPPPGADAWRASIDVTLKGEAKPWRLEIGGPVAPTAPPTPPPAAGAADAKPPVRTLVRAGGVLAETESHIGETLHKPAAEWRSPRWASFEVFRVEAFGLDDAKGHLALKRQDADWLRGSERIGFTPVSDVLYAVTGARGDKLLSRADATAAGANLAKPVVTLELLAADKSSETLSLYPALADGSAPAVASGREDVVVMLNKTFVDDLRNKLQALRSAEPMTTKASEGAGKQD